VTRAAADSFVDVDAVIEINKAGKVIDALPAEGLIGSIAFANWFEHGAADPDLRVAIHADFRWWDACERRMFHTGVAIPAIDAI
jgi:general stress protein 26